MPANTPAAPTTRDAVLDALRAGPATRSTIATLARRQLATVAACLRTLYAAGAVTRRVRGVYALPGDTRPAPEEQNSGVFWKSGPSRVTPDDHANLDALAEASDSAHDLAREQGANVLVNLATEDLSERFRCERKARELSAQACQEDFTGVHARELRTSPCWACPQGGELRLRWAFGLEPTEKRMEALMLYVTADNAPRWARVVLRVHGEDRAHPPAPARARAQETER